MTEQIVTQHQNAIKIVQAIADGKTRKQIAREAGVSFNAITSRIEKMRIATGAGDTYQLMAMLFREKLIK